MRNKIDLPDNYHFKTQIPIRITDLNYGGHVGNDTYLTLIHEARVQFLTHFGFSEIDIDGVGIIMNDAEIKFKAEVFYGTQITVKVAVANISEISCDFFYLLLDSGTGQHIAHARTGAVFFDYQKRKIAETPKKFKSKFIE